MYKQVMIIRTELKLSKGKIAAQVAHASLEAFMLAGPGIRREWRASGAKKVVLKARTLGALKRMDRKARSIGLPCSLIKDAGHTEIRPGTVTCLGVGPASEENIDKVTGELKVL